MRDKIYFTYDLYMATKDYSDRKRGIIIECLFDYMFKDDESVFQNKVFSKFYEENKREIERCISYSDNREQRTNSDYKEWRRAVFERDSYTCQKCGQVGGKLNAHHILHFSTNPELRTVVSNGITLCERCHHYIHSKEGLEYERQLIAIYGLQ